MPNDYSLREWMVNEALEAYLNNNKEALRWFFGLNTSRRGGETMALTELCGFGPDTEDFHYAFNEALTREDDCGAIPREDFDKTYWGVRPDFRFWVDGGRRQLIVEGKARNPNNRGDRGQAQRYFNYLRGLPAEGAVVYLVPSTFRQGFLDMLDQAVRDTRIPFGVICWDEEDPNDTVVRQIGAELAHSIMSSIAGPLGLIQRLLKRDRPKQ